MLTGITGIVTDVSYDIAIKAGFDYLEENLSVLGTVSEERFQRALKESREKGLPVIRSNGMFPGDIILMGENASKRKKVTEYLERALERAGRLGIKIAVFGSGRQRNCPEEMDRTEANERLLEICGEMADISRGNGIVIALEPLNRYESNVFNTVREGAEFVRKLNRPNFRLLADSYHMSVENESFDTLKSYTDVLVHTHVADSKAGRRDIRRIPCGNPDYNGKMFIESLIKAGYDGTVTVEAGYSAEDKTKEASDARACLAKWMKA